ncbi:MAG: hypothetical protein JXR96_21270 [Deltaproteobacteria bacterium]|nr:hypothetical protein [Deltaproteobacteria bacterium]
MEKEHFEVLLERIEHHVQISLEGHETLERRLDTMEKRLDARMDRVESSVDRLALEQAVTNQRLSALEGGQASLEQRQGALEQRQGALEEGQRAFRAEVERRFDGVEKDIREIGRSVSMWVAIAENHEERLQKVERS